MFGFRLPPKEKALFLAKAESLAMSPHDLARLYAMEKLASQEDAEDLREALGRLQADLDSSRRELALATSAILQFGGKSTPKDAEKFLREKMGFSPPDS